MTILQLNNDPDFDQEIIREKRIPFGIKKEENIFVLDENILFKNRRAFYHPH